MVCYSSVTVSDILPSSSSFDSPDIVLKQLTFAKVSEACTKSEVFNASGYPLTYRHWSLSLFNLKNSIFESGCLPSNNPKDQAFVRLKCHSRSLQIQKSCN